MNIYEKLLKIQMELKAPKGQTNKFGGYKYRSCEDILEALKPLCEKYKVSLVLNDDIVVIGEGNSQTLKNIDKKNDVTVEEITSGQRFYVKATAMLYNIELDKNGRLETVGNTAYARESESKKGMDESQITGTASSYARKYALNGLFNIDDTKDADTNEFKEQTEYTSQLITKVQEQSLDKAIENRKIDDETVLKILQKYGYTSTAEIKMIDYKKIVDEFINLIQE